MFRLKDYEYEVTSCSVAFDLDPDDQTLCMFIDIDANAVSEDMEYELRSIRLYHNNGFRTGVKNVKYLKGRTFKWTEEFNSRDEEAGTMYVVEHENISSGTIEIVDVTKESISIKWNGLANIYWDDEFGENVPFETEVVAQLPVMPKEKVLNGFKKTVIKFDKKTELELLNFQDFVNEVERCTELWRRDDRHAWEKFNVVTQWKMTYDGEEYLGQAIYSGSTRKCEVIFDERCPLNIQITETTLDSYSMKHNFYIIVEPK